MTSETANGEGISRGLANEPGRGIGHGKLSMGIDGGGTRTRAIVVNIDGTVLGYGEGGPANLFVYPEATVGESLRTAVSGALAQAGSGSEEVAQTVAGLAGAGTPEVAKRYMALLDALGSGAAHVVTDAEIALAGGLGMEAVTPGGCGAVLVAGTGSVAYARDGAGRICRAGGWGFLLGDEGGAAWIGREAVAAAIRAWEDRGPQTALCDLVQSALEIESVEEVRTLVAAGALSPARLGCLAAVVFQAARDGDDVSREITALAAHELALLVRTVWRDAGARPLGAPGYSLGSSPGPATAPFRVVKAGGLFALDLGLAGQIERELDQMGVPARLIDPSLSPVQGAALLALGKAGVATSLAAENLGRWRPSGTSDATANGAKAK